MLPIGIQSFRAMREMGCHYVDKTGFVLDLVGAGTRFFLSRPRRFGKSLLISTLESLFNGERELFRGLAIESHWDWSARYPVVRLDFGTGGFGEPGGLHDDLLAQLRSYERRTGTALSSTHGRHRLAELLESLHRETGRRVVVLVDEYDKPILDVLLKPELALANRDYLRDLYSVIKTSDEHVHFCFLTGVSNFSKVSLFSGLNNLRDITLAPRFSSICGYTEHDLDTVFAGQLEGLDRERVREWYKGYSWGAEERVYNPFDVLLLLAERAYRPWWFETGTPRFLIDHLEEKGLHWHRLDGLLASDELLSKFDLGDIAPEALLFQTGYLTVLQREDLDEGISYRMGYPNREVRQSLNRALLVSLLGAGWEREGQKRRLSQVLKAGDLAGMEELLRALLAGIPHQWHGRNPMGGYEGYYASVLYAHFAASGAEVRAEESGSRGRTDLCVRAFGRVYVFEFKMQERAGPKAAMEQLRVRGYADKYRGLGEPIHLVGVEFSGKTRNVTRFDTETA